MASEKQIAANRRNAMKSTGPRTEKGKSRSKMNATRHGFATSGWESAFQPAVRPSVGGRIEAKLLDLLGKRHEITRMRFDLLAKVDLAISSGQGKEVPRSLARAAALDRYERRVEAAVRRLLKGVGNSGEEERFLTERTQFERP